MTIELRFVVTEMESLVTPKKKDKISYNYREVVRLLEGKDSKQWHYITALRGPDDGNDTLKRTATCVIRGYPVTTALSLSDTRDYLRGWSDRAASDIHESIMKSSVHYRDHVRFGILALRFALEVKYEHDDTINKKVLKKALKCLENMSETFICNKRFIEKYEKNLRIFVGCVR